MANTQAQFGFQHVGFVSGSAPDYQVNSNYQIQSSYATAFFQGTPMVKSGLYIIPAASSAIVTAIVGIFQGVDYTPVGGAPTFNQYWPGAQAADGKAHIIDAPGALFKVAALLTAVPATAIGQNISFSTGAGGTTVGAGFATYVVDQASLTASTTAPFQVYSMYPGIGNGSDTTTNYNWVIVTFNNQRFKSLVGVA